MNRNVAFQGLNQGEVQTSRERNGANVFPKLKKKTIFQRLLDNLKDPIIKVLLIAMAVNVLFTFKNINYLETGGILLAILISTVVSSLSEYGSEKAFEKLRESQSHLKARVIRDGVPVELSFEELVVGDVVLLSEGEKIPADGALISGELKVDESPINGEARPCKKSLAQRGQSFVYGGTMVTEGEGMIRISAVGEKSVYGGIAEDIQQENGDSPLKIRLAKLANTVSKVGYVAAALVAFTYLFNVFVIDGHFSAPLILLKLHDLKFVALSVIKAVTIAVTVIVVAVPEGLPMMISVVLSSNMKKMLKGNVLVRKPVGIETAGSLNILFTDKTGTLTEGKLKTRELILGKGTPIAEKSMSTSMKNILYNAIYANSSVKYSFDKLIGGNQTEQALCNYLIANHILNSKNQNLNIELSKIPFDSSHKFSAVKIMEGSTQGVYFKGAPEKLLPYCTSCIDDSGRKISFSKEKIEELIRNYGKKSARILAFAVGQKLASPRDAGELTFLFIAVLSDKIRKEASKSIETLRKAGIQTVMMTGDSLETGRAIAEECGLMTSSQNLVLSGEELQRMTDREVSDILPRLAVIARALPKDKSRLVVLSQQKGLVVGMTGDGVNDAPALKKADVGFSMGSGAEIAKEAGDIVILDNNLASIVNAVLFGRTIFKSIRKFIMFQLAMNFCAVGVSFIGQLLGIDCPITVIQMLWVNMIMDTLGGLAFAGEYPMKHYLKEKPIQKNEAILPKKLLLQTILMGLYGIILCTVFLGSNKLQNILGLGDNPIKLMTAFFALFIFTGIAICFTTRSERMNLFSGLSKNKPFVIIMTFIVGIQMLMLYYGGETFRCVGIEWKTLLIVILLALTVIPFDFIRRMIMVYISKK